MSRTVWRAVVAALGLIVPVLGMSTGAAAQSAPSLRGVFSGYSISVEPGTSDLLTDSPVTVTVTAVDEGGNPTAGLSVTFTRSSSTESPTVATDVNGRAQWVFQPVAAQCSTQDIVTAVTRDPDSQVVLQTLNILIRYIRCEPSVTLSGESSKDGRLDVLEVSATTPDGSGSLKGVPVKLRAKVDGAWQHVGPGDQTLDAHGRVRIEVRDRNGNHVTTYRATVLRSDQAVATNKARLR